MFKRYSVHGVYRCGYGELFGMEGPQYYLFARLLDTPNVDPNEIVKEYCERAFGPAAVAMKEFFDTLDRRLMAINLMENKDSEFGTAMPQNPLDALAYVYTPEIAGKMNASLVQAEGLVETPKQKGRLALVRREFDYARNIGKVASLYASYRFNPCKLTFEPLADAIIERNKILDSIYGGNDDPTCIPVPYSDWPEIKPFGNNQRLIVMSNGRLKAGVGSPLRWDVKMMRDRDLLPGKNRMSLEVNRTNSEPGFESFEKGEWAKCEWKVLNGIMSEKPAVFSRFKILAGNEGLYIAAEGRMGKQPRIVGTDRDGPCGGEECFVLTVSPKDSAQSFYRFMWNVNPESRWDGKKGHITDPLDPKFDKVDSVWNGEWTVKSEFKEGLWRSMVKLPYSTLGESLPKKGAVWGFNLGRIADGAAKNSYRIFLQWNPNFENPRGILDANSRGMIRFK
jgi:hypothetical protein